MKPFSPDEIERFKRNGATDVEIEEYQRLQSERLYANDPAAFRTLAVRTEDDLRRRRIGELWRILNGERQTREEVGRLTSR
jgi:hypothetical protein